MAPHRWIPGRTLDHSGIVQCFVRPVCTVNLNNVFVYSLNVAKSCSDGLWWLGAGPYHSRAYQIINIRGDNLNQAMGAVAFPALCTQCRTDSSASKLCSGGLIE